MPIEASVFVEDSIGIHSEPKKSARKTIMRKVLYKKKGESTKKRQKITITREDLRGDLL